jgi:hypothetical protein
VKLVFVTIVSKTICIDFQNLVLICNWYFVAPSTVSHEKLSGRKNGALFTGAISVI